jgi:hypothetical protein
MLNGKEGVFQRPFFCGGTGEGGEWDGEGFMQGLGLGGGYEGEGLEDVFWFGRFGEGC